MEGSGGGHGGREGCSPAGQGVDVDDVALGDGPEGLQDVVGGDEEAGAQLEAGAGGVAS